MKLEKQRRQVQMKYNFRGFSLYENTMYFHNELKWGVPLLFRSYMQ